MNNSKIDNIKLGLLPNSKLKADAYSVSPSITKPNVGGSMVDSKALVLENGFVIDIPKELINYLKYENIEWDWYDTRFSFWKENRKATMKFFSELPIGKRIYCYTCFDGFQQLELFIQLLYKFKEKKFTFKIMHGCLAEDLLKFFDERESTITPDEIEKELDNADTDAEFKAANEKVKAFKKQMNEMFLEVLSFHNIYWINWHDEYLFKTLEDLKKANEV
jgi:hypothetical protein